MKVVAIADTHCGQMDMPKGDILLVAGDLTHSGKMLELESQLNWYLTLGFKHVVIISGNHDFCFEGKKSRNGSIDHKFKQDAIDAVTSRGIIYLEDSECTIEGVKIYGTPYTPWFYDWAFNVHRGPNLRAVYDKIPDNVDILLVHGPPKGFGDKTIYGETVGSEELLDVIKAKKPKYAFFGHIHEDPGSWQIGSTTAVNCSVGGHGMPYIFEI